MKHINVDLKYPQKYKDNIFNFAIHEEHDEMIKSMIKFESKEKNVCTSLRQLVIALIMCQVNLVSIKAQLNVNMRIRPYIKIII